MSAHRSSKQQPSSVEEIHALLRIAERDLQQAEVPGLYPDGRFGFAYNAALQLATVTLRLHQVRIGASSRHVRTFEELQRILPEEKCGFALEFEHARRKRHALMYDQAGTVSESEARNLIIRVSEYRDWLREYIKAHFSQYA
ncbi:hypothetical protein KAX17_09700 [Candidatus Bipolaricaulota bacterium]|nr:hypothetical protein [Candidatus Bipolaricaulota bacterium]